MRSDTPDHAGKQGRPRGGLRIAGLLAALLVGSIGGYLLRAKGVSPGTVIEHFRASEEPAQLRETKPPLSTFWHSFRPPQRAAQLDEDQQQKLEEVRSIGYLNGYEEAPAEQGVTVFDEDAAYHGLNLVVSAHAPEAALMDMRGEVLHQWRYPYEAVWPDYEPPNERAQGHTCWRRAYLLDNGDMLAIFEGIGLIKVDRDSQLLWDFPGQCHHDLSVAADGTIYVLAHKNHVVRRISRKPIKEDFVLVLDPEGHELRRVSLLESFENSVYASALDKMTYWGDIFHTNAVKVFDGSQAHRSSVFAAGHVLVSIWDLNIIAIVDLDAERVVWALSGMWKKQHDPTLLDTGRVLLFDNLGYGGHSKVIEFDPFTQAIAWTYQGDPPEAFHSFACGTCQRLLNGNTLITESTNGRAFEVTPDGHIVWELINPHRGGKSGELIATLFDVVRLTPDRVASWLEVGEVD